MESRVSIPVAARTSLSRRIPLAAQTAKRALRSDDVYRLRDVHDPQRSPDGKWVAYTVSTVDTARDRNISHIWIVSWDGMQQMQLTNSPESESSPRWSPDGEWLTFLSSGEGGDGAQLWRVKPRGGVPERVSSVPGGIVDYAWSPNSKWLVLVVSDTDAAKPKSGTKPPIVIDRYHFKTDPGGYVLGAHDHLALFDLAEQRVEPLTSGAFDDSDPVWSPDGTRIAFVSKRVAGDPDRSVNDDIFVINAQRGAQPKRLTTYDGEDDGRIAWSPDGTRIAYLTGVGLPDHSFRMWKLAVIPSDGGTSTMLSASLDRQVIEPAWSVDGSSIYVLEEDDRSQYVAKVSASGGRVERVAGEKRMITSLAIGRDGAATLTAASDSEPPEIYALEGTTLRRLTHQNDAWLREVQLGTTEEFASRGSDGYEVHGLIVKPAAFVAGRRYPTLLRIHGGPACCQDSHAFNIERELFAANGYVVVAANYRGSRGRGARHQRAIVGGTKEKEVSDLLGAIDYAVKSWCRGPRAARRWRMEQRRHSHRSDHRGRPSLQGSDRGRGQRERARELRHGSVHARDGHRAVDKSAGVDQAFLRLLSRETDHHTNSVHGRRQRLQRADRRKRADVRGVASSARADGVDHLSRPASQHIDAELQEGSARSLRCVVRQVREEGGGGELQVGNDRETHAVNICSRGWQRASVLRLVATWLR